MSTKITSFDKPEETFNETRRGFLKKSTALAAFAVASPAIVKAGENDEKIASFFEKIPLQIEVNGQAHSLSVEPRVTLLDLLREQLKLTGTKKGCDHGQCGACTVHVDGKRILSREVIADFTRSNQRPHFRQHGFIWQRDAREFHRPSRMSSHAYGHAGYTGQSMWIDPDNKRFVLVLSNRTHPEDHGSKSKEAQYRMLARIGDLALEAATS